MQYTAYDKDFVGWAFEQANLLRAGQVRHLDWEHLAEEIESMGKSDYREFGNRMAILIAHLLKWKYQPERQGNSWRIMIRNQRNAIAELLEDSPSLKAKCDALWFEKRWLSGVGLAMEETHLDSFPETPIWTIDQVLDAGFWPEP